MTTRKTLSGLESSQTPDQLVIRGRKMAVVLSAVAVLLLVPFSLTVAYQNIIGYAHVPAIWNRPTGDRIAGMLIILIIVVPWGIGSIAVCRLYLRRRQRSWVFNRRRKRLTRVDRSWALEDLTEIAVEIRTRSVRSTASAVVVLHLRHSVPLEIARFHAGKQRSLQSRIIVAGHLGNAIGEFLQMPVRQPTPPERGVEVEMPARS